MQGNRGPRSEQQNHGPPRQQPNPQQGKPSGADSNGQHTDAGEQSSPSEQPLWADGTDLWLCSSPSYWLSLLSCRCCFHYRPAELQEARWEDLHAEEQAVCGEPAHWNHRGGCGEALLQVWKTFWDLHQQGKRLWLHQAGEFERKWLRLTWQFILNQTFLNYF